MCSSDLYARGFKGGSQLRLRCCELTVFFLCPFQIEGMYIYTAQKYAFDESVEVEIGTYIDSLLLMVTGLREA